jgi:hypothetical protein
MKTALCALLALSLGIGIGTYSSWQEFQGERLPTKMTLAVLAERGTTATNDGPKLFVNDGEIYDFGIMDRGSKGKHDFVLRNIGSKPLVITMKETTCKCTAAAAGGKKLEKNSQITIPPEGSYTLTLDWLIKTAQPDFSQSAEFETNDPRREVVRLLIHGRTVEAVELSPASLRISDVTADEAAAGNISILSHRDQELKVLSHTWQNTEVKDFFTATFTPITPDEAIAQGAKGGIAVRVVVKPGLPLGITRQFLTLTTNYEGIESQTIPVDVKIVGDISLLGPKVPSGSNFITLGAVEQKVGLKHTVYLHIKGPHREMTEIEIERTEPASSLKATLGEAVALSPTVKRIPINIEIPADAPLGNYLGTDNSQTGRIYLKTTHPTNKQIMIPVHFVVR